METLSPHVVALFSTTGTALIMVFMGLRKNTIEWRRSPRRCAMCGREFRSRTCSCQ